MSTGEALPMPRLVLVSHSSAGDDLIAFHTSSSKLFFVATCAVNLLLPGYEALGADRGLADAATETLLMPLPSLVLHLLRTCSEDLAAAIASGSKLGIIAVSAVDLVCLASKLLVYERHSALGAKEASLMPMLVLVGQVLRVDADDLRALIAGVGEDLLVALDAVRMVVTKHVALSSQRLVTLPTAEVP